MEQRHHAVLLSDVSTVFSTASEHKWILRQIAARLENILLRRQATERKFGRVVPGRLLELDQVAARDHVAVGLISLNGAIMRRKRELSALPSGSVSGTPVIKNLLDRHHLRHLGAAAKRSPENG